MSDNYNAVEEMNNAVQDEIVDTQQNNEEVAETKVDKAFPISKRTKNDQSRTSVLYTVASIVLYVLAYLPIFIISLVLGIKCHNLVPYYSFWPFVGVIIAGLFGVIFMTIALVVTRKNSKRSIRSQTVRTLIAFVCLTCVFGLILTYIFPDVIAKATQSTLYCEDLYYNGEAQAEKNAKLERDFFMYNVLNGNLNEFEVDADTGALTIKENGDFSYKTLVKRTGLEYDNEYIRDRFNEWYENYMDIETIDKAIENLRKANPAKIELFDFIYKFDILNDYDYAFSNSVERRALGLAITDYIYKYFNANNGGYEGFLKEGFNNPRVKKLFIDNYNSFNQDGYLTFDDPLLLYAQVNGRMTIPVVLRLILNKGWSYTQPGYENPDGSGKTVYSDDGNFLYQLYDKAMVDEYVKNGGSFPYEGTLVDQNGNVVKDMYGYNEDGWMMFSTGYTKRPINWLVLDMLGDPMAITSLDNEIVNLVLGVLDQIGAVKAVGGLVQEDLADVIAAATQGSALQIGLCLNDDDALEINLFSMNAPYGMLGYMQATWVDSDNLLFAVINVVALRNWFCTLGAVGVVLIIAAGVCRDMGEKTRKRTEDSRDRIMLAKELGSEDNPENPETPENGESSETPAATDAVDVPVTA